MFGWGQVGGGEGCSLDGHRPRPDEVGLDAVSNEGKHSNTSMLDFSMTKETNGRFITLIPEIVRRKTKRIVELDSRVQLLSERFQVSLCLNIYVKMFQ